MLTARSRGHHDHASKECTHSVRPIAGLAILLAAMCASSACSGNSTPKGAEANAAEMTNAAGGKGASPTRGAAASTGFDAGTWKKPSDAELKTKLTSMQYQVTQHEGTEPAFHNEYWDNHEPGIYVDIVSGEPLFSSLDKFDSGTGWPSFTRPLVPENINGSTDTKIGYERTALTSTHAGSHLGHVFDDGPKPTGLRYCLDSAALRFVPAAELQAQGYGEFAPLFANEAMPASSMRHDGTKVMADDPMPAMDKPSGGEALATFAGGCFWCVETAFEGRPGVSAVISGYTGGSKVNPTYEEVGSGSTGHAESVQIHYDPSVITYAQLLDIFWHNIDPTQSDAQFCDHGRQYRSSIFYGNEDEHRLDEETKADLEANANLPGKIVTEIVAATTFYPAEEYHQDFYKKDPVRYQGYRLGCGRDARLKKLWGDKALNGSEPPAPKH